MLATVNQRKNNLICSIKLQGKAARLEPERLSQFEEMLRRAKTFVDQDQVMKAFEEVINGWKHGNSIYDRLLQRRAGLRDDEEEDL